MHQNRGIEFRKRSELFPRCALNGTTFVRVTVLLNFQWAFRAEPFSLYTPIILIFCFRKYRLALKNKFHFIPGRRLFIIMTSSENVVLFLYCHAIRVYINIMYLYYCKVSIAFPAHYNVYKCIEYLKRNVRVQNVIYTHGAPLCIMCATKRAGEHKRRYGEDKCKCVNAADVTLYYTRI